MGRPHGFLFARPAKALKEGAELECGECRLKVGRRQGMFVEVRLPLPAEEFFPKFGRYHFLRISNAMLLSQMTFVTSRCLLKRLARSRHRQHRCTLPRHIY